MKVDRSASNQALPDDVLETPRGRLVISHPVPAVIVFTYRGHATVEMVPFIESSVNRVLSALSSTSSTSERGAPASTRPDLFIDLGVIDGYDAEYRQAVSKWGAKHYRLFGEVRVFVRSKIVAMGIAVSNLTAAGRLKPTTKRAEFDVALAAAIAKHSPVR